MSQEKKQDKKQKQLSKKRLEDLEKEVQECKKLKEEYLAGWQRAKADFLNYQKEGDKRIEMALNFIQKEWILKILAIHDNLERAREHVPPKIKDIDWVKGVLQIEGQFHSFFKENGVERINSEGKQFDPNFHEAVEQIEGKGKESGIIVEVLEKGYMLNGRVIRPAKVKIAK